MAITQSIASTFKQELMQAVHDFDTSGSGGDTFKIALYTSSANLSSATTAYTTSGEVVGTGYTAGGNTLTNQGVSLSGTTAYTDFADSTWSSASFTAAGAMIYNSSKSNKAVAIFNFGGDFTCTNGDFTVIFPAATSSTAVLILS